MKTVLMASGSFLLGAAVCLLLTPQLPSDSQSYESLGPTVQRIESLGLLTVLRVSIADVLVGAVLMRMEATPLVLDEALIRRMRPRSVFPMANSKIRWREGREPGLTPGGKFESWKKTAL